MKTPILLRTLLVLSVTPLILNAAHTSNLKRIALKERLNSMEGLCHETSFQEKLSQQKLMKNFRSALRRQNPKALTHAIENVLAFTLITQEQLDIMLLKEIATAKVEEQTKEWTAFLQAKLGRSTSPIITLEERKA